jgi:hypothetical protein
VLIGFRVVYVFDIAQTEGAELPEPATVSGEVGTHLDRLIDFVQRQAIELEYNERIAPAQGVSYGGKIALLPGQTKAEEFSTLVHEVAPTTSASTTATPSCSPNRLPSFSKHPQPSSTRSSPKKRSHSHRPAKPAHLSGCASPCPLPHSLSTSKGEEFMTTEVQSEYRNLPLASLSESATIHAAALTKPRLTSWPSPSKRRALLSP